MKQAYDHISLNSVQNAAVVLNEIIAAMEKAIENPEVYAPDKYKSENDEVIELLKYIDTE